MSDPHVSPKGETPMQRRERLMNLTNESWIAPPPNPEDEEDEEEETKEKPQSSPKVTSLQPTKE